MIKNKNIIKTKNNRADLKTAPKNNFYGVVEYNATFKDGKGRKQTVTKSGLITLDGAMTRIQAKREVDLKVKALGGKLVYFGAFKNSK